MAQQLGGPGGNGFRGHKRPLDLEATSATQMSAGQERRRRVLWMPFSVYEREQRKEGVTRLEEILDSWFALLLSGTEPVQKIDGQWHWGRYEGYIDDQFTTQATVHTVAQKTALVSGEAVARASAAQLAELQALWQTLRAAAVKAPDCPAAAVLDDKIVRGVAAAPDPMLVGTGLLSAFTDQADCQKALDDLYAEEEQACQAFAKPARRAQDHELMQIEIMKLCTKFINRIHMSRDQVLPEVEGLIAHCEQAHGDCAEDSELKAALDSAKKCVKDVPTEVDAQVASLRALVTEAQASVRSGQAFDIDKLKDKLTDVLKQPAFSSLQLARKACSTMKTILSKKKAKLQRDCSSVRAQKGIVAFEAVASGDMSNLEAYLAGYWVQHGDFGVKGTETALFGTSAVKADKLDDLVLKITSLKGWSVFCKWFQGVAAAEQQGASTFSASITHPSLLRELQAILVAGTPWGRALTQKRIGLAKEEQEVLNKIFAPIHYSHAAGHIVWSVTPYCLPECRLLLAGREVVFGVKYSTGGLDMKAQVAELQKLSGAELAKKAETTEGFSVVLNSGSIVILPPGYLVGTYAAQPCSGIRWSLSSGQEDESKMVLGMLTALLESYPTLRRTEYNAWMGTLRVALGA